MKISFNQTSWWKSNYHRERFGKLTFRELALRQSEYKQTSALFPCKRNPAIKRRRRKRLSTITRRSVKWTEIDPSENWLLLRLYWSHVILGVYQLVRYYDTYTHLINSKAESNSENFPVAYKIVTMPEDKIDRRAEASLWLAHSKIKRLNNSSKKKIPPWYMSFFIA